MIVPYTWDLTVYVGTDFTDAIQFTLNGSAISLTGYTAYDQIRSTQAQDGTLIAEFTCTVTAETGTVTLTLTDTITKDITATSGYHTLVLRDADGIDLPYAMGGVTFVNTSTVVP